MVKIGIWEKGDYRGCVIFSRGATEKLVNAYGLDKTEGCELTRVALRGHITPVSRILSVSLKMLKNINPKLRLIVSFADPYQAHHGGIYQASGWIYCGTTNPSKSYLYNGKELHERQVSVSGKKKQFGEYRDVPIPSQCIKVEKPGKYRYLMPLDKEMREKVQKLSKPYPKRTKQAMTETIGTAAGKHRPVRSNIEAA